MTTRDCVCGELIVTVNDFSLEFRGIRFWNGPISRRNAE